MHLYEYMCHSETSIYIWSKQETNRYLLDFELSITVICLHCFVYMYAEVSYMVRRTYTCIVHSTIVR